MAPREVRGKNRPERAASPAHCADGYLDAALGEQDLRGAMAEGEPTAGPHSRARRSFFKKFAGQICRNKSLSKPLVRLVVRQPSMI
jgi:hypothetical protein